ncbi:MAG: hypothetical protein A2070_13990 [Bdellovibrionales bacterium GWC1_52_8]|nr:MAG: hypothetical protein A2Z97_11340 [Bdellovibrionales bacterium GWB1_52_6]OFZ02963.1 MAG: hypothetical protein A2X97_04665 [Bdellovibrionales bacterium GWA1_52_35]OFZ38040.1 MAG: hypothetical protein A2070_13990 [Bdellovibrionales bacterium GWC1_52_8]HCM38451.1 hypothetical protein [Bdellovibrionales bacterium]
MAARISRPESGAVLVFSGLVRNEHNQKTVLAVTYDAHVVLAQEVLKQICTEIHSRTGAQIAIAHRTGPVAVGEASVIIAVGAPHRAEAYEASRTALEEIKTRLPVWKKEHYEDGESQWLPGHSLRTHAE